MLGNYFLWLLIISLLFQTSLGVSDAEWQKRENDYEEHYSSICNPQVYLVAKGKCGFCNESQSFRWGYCVPLPSGLICSHEHKVYYDVVEDYICHYICKDFGLNGAINFSDCVLAVDNEDNHLPELTNSTPTASPALNLSTTTMMNYLTTAISDTTIYLTTTFMPEGLDNGSVVAIVAGVVVVVILLIVFVYLFVQKCKRNKKKSDKESPLNETVKLIAIRRIPSNSNIVASNGNTIASNGNTIVSNGNTIVSNGNTVASNGNTVTSND